jgi:hypothetical protein
LGNERVVAENEEKGAVLSQTVKFSLYVKTGENKIQGNQNPVSTRNCYCNIKIITYTALKCSLVRQKRNTNNTITFM